MFSCVLCLKDISFFENSFDLYSHDGQELNIYKILTTIFHFLQLNSEINKNERICCDCWKIVKNFNSFYLRILATHKSVTSLLQINDDIDPISNATFEKSLDNSSFSDLVNEENNEFLVINEIKVEVNELELFPSIEILENPVNSNTQESLTPSAPPKQDILITSANANAKRIKSEETVSKVETEIVSDSDSDVPLSEYLSIDLKTDHNDDEPIQPIKFTNDTTNDTKCLKRKRGRPRKVQQIEAEIELINCESEQEAESDFGISKAGKESFVHVSLSTNDDDDSNDSWRCKNLKKSNTIRTITKSVTNKPKKYRIRKKPLLPPVKLSREEIDKRRAQQEEYDEIIRKFFNEFSCPVCNELVQDFSDLRRHFRVTHDNEHGYMTCCGRKFHLRKVLAEHVLVHWNPEHFKCVTCERSFQDLRSLEVHENAHKNPETKDKEIFQCDKCPKSFRTKAAFEYHSYSKHVPKSEFKFSCKECNKKLPTKRKLKDHMKYIHDPESAIICDKCGKQVRTQTSLKNHHKLEHSNEPRPEPTPMQCEICGTWLRHLTGLKQHMKSIHEEAGGDHRCHICNKSSTNSRALKRHIYHNHECERKFKCTMCEKAFKRPQDLREHKSTHTGEALYTCPNCSMTFFSNANMYKHRQRLHRAEWEADRKKPNVNIMRQAVGATEATKLREAASTDKIDYLVRATTCSVSTPETTQ